MPRIEDAAAIANLLETREACIERIKYVQGLTSVCVQVHESSQTPKKEEPEEEDTFSGLLWGFANRNRSLEGPHIPDWDDHLLKRLLMRYLLDRLSMTDLELHGLGFDFPEDYHQKLLARREIAAKSAEIPKPPSTLTLISAAELEKYMKGMYRRD